MLNPNGRVIYRGPSRLDGKTPIVVVITGLSHKSANLKTDDMLQTWILVDKDVSPNNLVHEGKDSPICGDCPFSATRGCYVSVYQAPRAVWNCERHGSGYGSAETDSARSDTGSGRSVRIGSYGDPAAVPVYVWRSLTARATSWTGYTHQWRTREATGLEPYCVASCETLEDVRLAHSLGWRTFRVSASVDPVAGLEILCPASKEAGQLTTCAQCGLCQGSERSARSIVIVAHGRTAGRAVSALSPVAVVA